MLGLHRCTGFSLVAVSRGSSRCVCVLLIVVSSLVVECGPRGERAQVLWLLGSTAQAQELWNTGFMALACGIFLEQGLNPCLLRCQADSSPLSHQKCPLCPLLNQFFFSLTPFHPLCWLGSNTLFPSIVVPKREHTCVLPKAWYFFSLSKQFKSQLENPLLVSSSTVDMDFSFPYLKLHETAV